MSIAFTVFTGITVYLVYCNWSLISDNIHCIKFNNYKKIKIWCIQLYKTDTTKQIKIKDRTYYFYNNITNLENFDVVLLKIDKKSYKDINIYNIGYVKKEN